MKRRQLELAIESVRLAKQTAVRAALTVSQSRSVRAFRLYLGRGFDHQLTK
jgi:hypothetical protein